MSTPAAIRLWRTAAQRRVRSAFNSIANARVEWQVRLKRHHVDGTSDATDVYPPSSAIKIGILTRQYGTNSFNIKTLLNLSANHPEMQLKLVSPS
eukprot:8506154-Pyramimonas_sp.AAC.1